MAMPLPFYGSGVTCQRSHEEAGRSLISLAPEDHLQLLLLQKAESFTKITVHSQRLLDTEIELLLMVSSV